MEYYTLARVIHVIAIVIWIGGVAMVTSVILPSVRKFKSAEEQMDFFELVENRFAKQAKITTLISMISGLYMLYVTDGWFRYLEPSQWWLWAMTIIWLLFTLVLFVLEPLFLHRWFRESAKKDPVKTFKIIQRFHWILLTLSMITIFAAVAGSHGWLLF
jgi:uncharacterized membrane protein